MVFLVFIGRDVADEQTLMPHSEARPIVWLAASSPQVHRGTECLSTEAGKPGSRAWLRSEA